MRADADNAALVLLPKIDADYEARQNELRDILVNKLLVLTEGKTARGLYDFLGMEIAALSPKMARSSFSSGVGSLSPLGVILPIMMSPGTTCAHGRKTTKECKTVFKNVRYEEGTITAVSYDVQGKEISRNALKTAKGKTVS